MELFFSSLPPLLLAAIKVSIPLAVISFIFGVGIAVITALARLSNNAILRFIFCFYVWIFRGTPLLVQLFIVFYGLPSVGVTLDVWACATIAFSLNVGAYASESVRAAILAVPKGQVEAAASLNMSSAQIFFHIVAPQAFRIAIPPLSNSFIALVKDTSLAASITMVDMFMVAQRIAARTYEPLLLYVEVALIYLVICTVLSGIQVILERKANAHLKVES